MPSKCSVEYAKNGLCFGWRADLDSVRGPSQDTHGASAELAQLEVSSKPGWPLRLLDFMVFFGCALGGAKMQHKVVFMCLFNCP